MEDLNEVKEDSVDEEKGTTDESKIQFICPTETCGVKERDEVLFLCNTCERDELIDKEGILICPSCLTPGSNFECTTCGSTDVVMKEV